jgi:hypothetical protein
MNSQKLNKRRHAAAFGGWETLTSSRACAGRYVSIWIGAWK